VLDLTTVEKRTARAKKLVKSKQAQVRSWTVGAHIAEGRAFSPLPDANRSSVRQGVRTQGTDDDLGAAAKAGVDAKQLPGGAQRKVLKVSWAGWDLSCTTTEGLSRCCPVWHEA
jgi:hypothetical protein